MNPISSGAPRNDIVIGTETGGFLHSTDNGLKWTSLDPNFTDLNSTNPLGRVGNATIAGFDKYGNILCKGITFASAYSSLSNWAGVTLIGWLPTHGAIFPATHGLPANFVPPRIVTIPSGDSFTCLNQDYFL